MLVVNLVIPPAPTSKIDWGSNDYSVSHGGTSRRAFDSTPSYARRRCCVPTLFIHGMHLTPEPRVVRQINWPP